MAPRRRKTWPPEYRDDDRPERTATVEGRRLRRYEGEWFGQFIESPGGVWRPVRWLGWFTISSLLDEIGEREPDMGQQSLLTPR